MIAQIQMYVIGAVTFVAALIGVYLKGKATGRRTSDLEADRRRLETMKKAKDVRDEVMDDPYLVERAAHWVREDRDQ